jgi:hypothetical protein
MFIFNDYFFLFFRKTARISAPKFYGDKGKTKVDKQDTLSKPQIVPHKTEMTIHLSVFQIKTPKEKWPLDEKKWPFDGSIFLLEGAILPLISEIPAIVLVN